MSPNVPPFTGDAGIAAARRIRVADGARRLFMALSVSDLGDLRTYTGLFEIDGTGKVIAPLTPDAAPGAYRAGSSSRLQKRYKLAVRRT